MKKAIKVAEVTLVGVASIALSYQVGKRIERTINDNDELSVDEKIVYAYGASTLAGGIIGLIARHIAKRIWK